MNASNREMLRSWIIKEEGFRDKPYQCSEGVWTFGHGLTSITEQESLTLVGNRLADLEQRVKTHLRLNDISLDEFRICILIDMAYQLGVNGLRKFAKMFNALKDYDYELAADEMLNSKWHKQTPVRCELLAKRMRKGF